LIEQLNPATLLAMGRGKKIEQLMQVHDCNIVTLLTVYNSVTVVQIEGMNYGSD